jgi:hypothetical protein
MLDNIILQISLTTFFVSREKSEDTKIKRQKIILPNPIKSQPLLSQYTTPNKLKLENQLTNKPQM